MKIDGYSIPKEVWGVSFDDFVGPHAVNDQLYGFDGRDEENGIHFDAEISDRVLWVSPDGAYTARPAADPDGEPATTVLLVHGGDGIVGYYAGGMVWIDPEHRGQGLAPWLVLSACAEAGGVPYGNSEKMGFSEAGIAAHRAAHRLAVALALEAGLQVPDDVARQSVAGPAL